MNEQVPHKKAALRWLVLVILAVQKEVKSIMQLFKLLIFKELSMRKYLFYKERKK